MPPAPGFVFGNDGLVQNFANLLRKHAAGEVDNSPGSVRNDEMKRPIRKVLGARRQRPGDNERRPEQKSAADFKRFIRFSCSGTALPPVSHFGDQFNKLVRRDGHLRNAHVEWRQRILDRGDHRRGGGNDADLADAFDAKRLCGDGDSLYSVSNFGTSVAVAADNPRMSW